MNVLLADRQTIKQLIAASTAEATFTYDPTL